MTTETRSDRLAPSLNSALPPLYQEILAALQALVEHGQRHSIDLRALPLAPGDDERLERFLGRGEVRAELDSLGRSEFSETAYSGVWLVTHYNSDDQVVGRFVEIAPVPELLLPPTDDLLDSRAALSAALEEIAGPAALADTAAEH